MKRTHLSTPELAAALGVAAAASPVAHVDQRQVDAIAAQIRARQDLRGLAATKWDNSEFWNVEDGARERSQFFAIGSAVNFRYWELADGEMRPTEGRLDARPRAK